MRGLLYVANSTQAGDTVPIGCRLGRGDDRDRNLRQARGLSQPRKDAESVTLGRIQVQENRVRYENTLLTALWWAKNAERLLAVIEQCHFARHTILLQRQPNEEHIRWIIFNKDDLTLTQKLHFLALKGS